MAIAILDELLAKLDPDSKAKVEAAIAANPDLKTRDAEGQHWLEYLSSPSPTPAPAPAPAPAAAAPTPAPSPSPVAAPAPAPAASPMADLDALGKLLDTKLSTLRTDLKVEMAKEFVPASKIADFEKALAANLSTSIKLSHELSTIERNHEKEFTESLDVPAFEKYIEEHKGQYKTLKDAHDSFVMQKRVDLQIKKGVEDGVKQRTSATSVPAQTQKTSMAPAAQILAKARAAKESQGDGTRSSLETAIAKIKAAQAANEDVSAA